MNLFFTSSELNDEDEFKSVLFVIVKFLDEFGDVHGKSVKSASFVNWIWFFCSSSDNFKLNDSWLDDIEVDIEISDELWPTSNNFGKTLDVVFCETFKSTALRQVAHFCD